MKSILLITLALISYQVMAAEKSYIREYTYKASDLDSKVSARSNALKQIKSIVLEEIVSFVRSESRITQTQKQEYDKEFIHTVNNISAGLVKSKILDERWNGVEFWLKAEILVDPTIVKKELKELIAKSQHNNKTPDQFDINTTIHNTQEQTANYSNQIKIAHLSQVLSLLTPIKMQFLQYKMAHNKWPTSFEEIGYASSDMRDDEYIENIIIGDGGKIYALLNNKFGTNMVVMLMQEEIMGGMHLRSKCLTNLPKSVTSMISVCKSVKKISLPH